MKKLLFFLIISAFLFPLSAQEVKISQIDTNRLLLKGRMDIYFTASEDALAENFQVTEKDLGLLEIISFESAANKNTGIDFLLLIDNSGSMYDESYQGSIRIAQAKLALNSFLDQMDSSEDRAAVYAFNTNLDKLAGFGSNPAEIRRSISALRQPRPDEAYTELYNSLAEITSLFPKEGGRKAVIVLSDGENFSLYNRTGKLNSVWGSTTAVPNDLIRLFHNAGISLDGINISDNRDAELQRICMQTGGSFYDVRSTNEIENVYTEIRNRILKEYRITVAAPPFKNTSAKISVEYNGNSDSRTVLTPALFGTSSGQHLLIILIMLFCGTGGLAALYLIPYEKAVGEAQIQSIGTGGKTVLSGEATIIGADKDADYTIAGNPGVDAHHATILNDTKTGTYTLVSEKPVHVNNRKLKNKKLAPGDVIRIEGSTIIFDMPETTVYSKGQ